MTTPQRSSAAASERAMAAHTSEYKAALRFAKQGWLVGFMPHGTKHGGPGTEGLNSFSDDPEALLAWRVRMGSKCNIALIAPEGSMVIDVDLYKLHGLEWELADAKVKKFYTDTGCSAARSANGGIHLLVQDPGDGTVNNATVRALFDCPGEIRRRKGTGRGYIIGPGSMVNDKKYEEIKGHEFDGRAAPTLPPGVLKPTAISNVTPAIGNAAAQDFDPVAQGAGEPRLVLPLSQLRNALSAIPADDYFIWLRVGMALQHDYGDHGFKYWDWWSQKSPKYDGGEKLQAKWDSFGRNPNITPVTADTIHYIAREYGYGRASAQQEFGRGWLQKYKVAPKLSEDPPAHDWVLQGVLLRGKVAMLAGAGGSGKSMLMYRIASMYAMGVPHVLGYQNLTLFDPPMQPGKVLILSAEDDADDVHRRIFATAESLMVVDGAMRERLGERVAIFPVGGMDCRLVDAHGKASDFADRIVEECNADGQVGLVMLDPSIFFSGVNDNDAESVASYMRVLTGIAKRSGTGVLAITHTNKGAMSAETVDQSNVRGSSAFVDLARSAFVMRGMVPAEAVVWQIDESERWRYVGITVVKNNYAPQTTDPIWLQRGPGGTLHAPNPPITKLTPQAMAAAKHARTAEAQVQRASLSKMHKQERSMLLLLADTNEHNASTPAKRGIRTGQSERTVKSLMAEMVDQKWVKIKVHASISTPHTYELTAGGRARLAAYEKERTEELKGAK